MKQIKNKINKKTIDWKDFVAIPRGKLTVQKL